MSSDTATSPYPAASEPLPRRTTTGSDADLGRRLKEGWPPLALGIAMLTVWELASRLEWVSHLILPPPSGIGLAFIELFRSGIVWEHLVSTLSAAIAGLAVGGSLGFGLAVLSSFWEPFRRTIEPYMIVLQVTPRIALAPVFITWFGFGLTPKVVLAATICFFPIFINTLTGLVTVDRDSMEMFRSMRATKRQVFTQLTLPGAMPVTIAGVKTAVTLTLIGAIVAEFVAGERGLGFLLQRYNFRLAMDSAFAVLLLLAGLGLLMYGIAQWGDRRFVFWTDDSRLAKKRMKVGSN